MSAFPHSFVWAYPRRSCRPPSPPSADARPRHDRAGSEGRSGSEVGGIGGGNSGLLREERGPLPAAGVIQLPKHLRRSPAEANRRAGKERIEEGAGRAAKSEDDQELSGFRLAGRERFGRR